MSGGTDQLANTGTVSGVTYTNNLNIALSTIATAHQSASAPTTGSTGLTSLAGIKWHDISAANKIKLRDQADTAWIVTGKIDETAKIFAAYEGPEQSIASATSTDLGTIVSNNIKITGTTTITGLGSSADINNPYYFVSFAASLTLTHNATSLILPDAANIVTVANDWCIAKYLGTGNWRVVRYFTPTPKARAHQATGTTSIATSTFTKITFDTTDFDTNSNWSSSRFTATSPGFYRVSAIMTIASVFTGTIALAIDKNGSTFSQSTGGAGSNQGWNIADIVQLAVGDYIEIFGFQSSGGTLATIASGLTSIAIEKLP